MKLKTLTSMAVTGLLVTGLTTTAWATSPKMITQKPVMKMTTPLPENITTPAKVESPIGTLEFFDGITNAFTRDAVYDYVDRARAVQMYITMMPAVSTYSLRPGK